MMSKKKLFCLRLLLVINSITLLTGFTEKNWETRTVLEAAIPRSTSELQIRDELKNLGGNLFIDERFEDLDLLAQYYLTNQCKTPSGSWMFAYLLRGIERVGQEECRTESCWLDLKSKTMRWVERYPDSPLAYNVHAAFLINQAWFYRGAGVVRLVKPESWKPFHEYLAKARAFLLENKEVASKIPYFYENMLIISKGENWKDSAFQTLLEEAISKYPHYQDIYLTAVPALCPKWGGSSGKIDALVKKAVEGTKDRMGMTMYARIYRRVYYEQYKGDLFRKSAANWEEMKFGLDDLIWYFPSQYNIQYAAFFACVAKDMDAACGYFKQMRTHPNLYIWPSFKTYRHYREKACGTRFNR